MKRASLRQKLGLLLLLVAALCVVGCGLVVWETRQAETALEDLQQQVQTQPAPAPAESQEEAPAGAETGETPLVFPAAWQEKNRDLAAWLRVTGTGIDLPVMLTPDAPEHYLRRGVTGTYSLSGTPFFDARCTDPAAADCLIVYGHNMNNGTMFSNLLQYASASYGQAHPTATLALPGETRTYQLFAALHLDTGKAEDEALYDNAGELTPAQFTSLVQTLQSRALYDTGLSPQMGQKLLLLSTCARDQGSGKNGRMVVAFVAG